MEIQLRLKAQQDFLRFQVDEREKHLQVLIDLLKEINNELDPYTSGHQSNVAELTGAIAKKMCLSKRPYRPVTQELDKAFKHLSEKEGIWFDPRVVDACIALD